eukprot:266380-Rhodomonas_salina.3
MLPICLCHVFFLLIAHPICLRCIRYLPMPYPRSAYAISGTEMEYDATRPRGTRGARDLRKARRGALLLVLLPTLPAYELLRHIRY